MAKLTFSIRKHIFVQSWSILRVIVVLSICWQNVSGTMPAHAVEPSVLQDGGSPWGEYMSCNNTLTWAPVPEAVSYDVYTWTDAPDTYVSTTETSIALLQAAPSAQTGNKLYWRVDAHLSNGEIIQGHEWPFFIVDSTYYPLDTICAVHVTPDTVGANADLQALIDGTNTQEPFALVNPGSEPVSVTFTFNGTAVLTGFTSLVGGLPESDHDYDWSIEADQTGDGNFQMLLDHQSSATGAVTLTLPEPQQAKVFKVTSKRNSGDGSVQMSKLMPLFADLSSYSSMTASANQAPADGTTPIIITMNVKDQHGLLIEKSAGAGMSATGHAHVTKIYPAENGTAQISITDDTAETVRVAGSANSLSIGSIDIEFVASPTATETSAITSTPEPVCSNGWCINGSAETSSVAKQYILSKSLQSQSGSVWNQTPINLTDDFDKSFAVYLGNDDNGADGLVFVLQNAGTQVVGSGGLGMGYMGITPSIGVEVDTWSNDDFGDPPYDHIAIDENGTVNHQGAAPVQASSQTKPNIEDGAEHLLRVTWSQATQKLTVFFDGSERLSYTKDLINDIFDGNPQVYFGFTGGTGIASNLQYVMMDTTTILPTVTSTATSTFVPSTCQTWNLAEDFLAAPDQENPNRDSCGAPGIWTFMSSANRTRDPATYLPLSNFTPSRGGIPGLPFWMGTYSLNPDGQFPMIGFNSTGETQLLRDATIPPAVDVHPAPDQLGVIAWRSPVDGVISITGGVSDNNANGGDGILWYIDRNETNLAAGEQPNGGAQRFADGEGGASLNNVTVSAGDLIYLAIDPNGDYTFDDTRVDISISLVSASTPTHTPTVTVTPTLTPAPYTGSAWGLYNACDNTLTWEAVPGAVSYDVYTGLNAPVTPVSTTELSMSLLDAAPWAQPGDKVYWRVDAHLPGGETVTGHDWPFALYSPYPYDICAVRVVPDSVGRDANLHGLFDGDPSQYALINPNADPVSVLITFRSAVKLKGFTSVVGGSNESDHENDWSIEADDAGDGHFQTLLDHQPTATGLVTLTLPQPHLAKVFKVTSKRNNGDGFVHMLELTPLFGTVPHSSVMSSANAVPADGTTQAVITVTVLDQYGVPVENAPVFLTATGHGNLTQPGPTNANGTTQAFLVDETTEAVTLTAKAGAATIGTVNIQFVPLPTDPNHSSVSVSAAPTLVANNSDKATLTVTLLDSKDRPEAGHAVRLYIPNSVNNVFPSLAHTDINGVAVLRLASTQAGEKVISIIDDTNQVTLSSIPHLTFVPGLVNAVQSKIGTTFSAVAADGVSTANFVVTAYDAFANPIPNATVMIHTDGDSVADQASATTNSAGQSTFSITDSTPETINVTATINGVLANATGHVRFRSADVSVEMGSLSISNNGYSTSTAASGFPITYTITLSNLGLIDANNVVVTDTLPGVVTFNSATPSDLVARNGNIVTWNIPHLAQGTSIKLEVSAQIAANFTGLLINSAAALTSSVDDTPSNNTRQIAATVEAPRPVISLIPASSFAAVTQGASASFTITARNTGLAETDGISITPPPALPWVSVDISGTDLTLAPGNETTFQVLAAPTTEIIPGYYRDFVTVASQGDAEKRLALTLQIAAPKHTLRVTVKNDQGATVPGARLLLQNSSDYVVVTEGTQTQTYKLNASAQADANGVATFTGLEAGNYGYLASAAKHTDLNGTLALPFAQDADATVILTALPALSVSPNTPVLSVLPGQNVAQTFTIQNDGSAPLTNVSITPGSDLPTWVYLGTSSIPVVNPGQSASFSLFASPPTDETRSIVGGHLTVSAASGLAAPITLTTRLEAVGARPLTVQVRNILGQPVTSSGTVTLVRQEASIQDLGGAQTTYHEQYSQSLAANGSAQFTSLPPGDYNFTIDSPEYKLSTGTINILGNLILDGAPQVFDTTLQADSFNYEWTVQPVQVGYDVHLTLTYDTVTAAPGLFIPPRYWTFFACGSPQLQDTIKIYNPTNIALDLSENFSINVPGTTVSFNTLPSSVAPHSSVNVPVTVFRSGETGQGIVETPFSYQGAKDPYVTYTVNPSSRQDVLQLGQTFTANYGITPGVFTPGVIYAVQAGQASTLNWINLSTESSPAAWDTNTAIPLTLTAQTPAALADGMYQDEIPVTVTGSNGAERSGKLLITVTKNGSDLQLHTSYELGPIPTETQMGSSSGFIVSSLQACNSEGSSGGGTNVASGGGWAWNWLSLPGGFSLQGSQSSATIAPVPPPFPQLVPPPPVVYGDDHQEVRLGIDQHIMLEGEGFNAKLSLRAKQFDLKNVRVDLKVTDLTTNIDSTDKFNISPGLPSTFGDIPAGGQSSKDWLILPSGLNVMASEGQKFNVRAVISWEDANGESLSVETASTEITVLPAPNLEITYNLPRGNEQCTTFPLQVIFHNVGAGTARNVHFSSAQPKLVDGTQSPLSFTITKAAVNNVDQGPSLNLSLGDIPPASETEVDFTFTASQPGKFVEFTSDYRQSDYVGQVLKPLISKINTQLILSTVCGVLPVVTGRVEYAAGASPLVTFEAQDHSGLGIKQILYSLDNAVFQAYGLPFSVLDPFQTPVIYAYAEDNAGQRSELFTLDVASECKVTWSWCNGQPINEQPQSINGKPQRIDVMALSETDKLKFAHAISKHCREEVWCDGQISLNTPGYMDHDQELSQNEIEILFEAAGLENTKPGPDHQQRAHDFARMLKAIAYGEGFANLYTDYVPRQFINSSQRPERATISGSKLGLTDVNGNLIPVTLGDDYLATKCDLDPSAPACSRTYGIGIMQLTFNIYTLHEAVQSQCGQLSSECKTVAKPIQVLTASPACQESSSGCAPVIDDACTEIVTNKTAYPQLYNQIGKCEGLLDEKTKTYPLPQGVLIDLGTSYPGAGQVKDKAWSDPDTGWKKERLQCSYPDPNQSDGKQPSLINPNTDSLFTVQVEVMRAIKDPYYNICKAAEALQWKQKLNTDWCRVTDTSKPGDACETAPKTLPPLTYGTNPNSPPTAVDPDKPFIPLPQSDYDRAQLAALYKTGKSSDIDFLNLIDPVKLVKPAGTAPNIYVKVSVLDDSPGSESYLDSRELCHIYNSYAFALAGRNDAGQANLSVSYSNPERFVNYPSLVDIFPPPGNLTWTSEFVTTVRVKSKWSKCFGPSESSVTPPPSTSSIIPSRIALDLAPIVEWKAPTVLTTKDCGGSRKAHYSVTQDGTVITQGEMEGDPLSATVPALAPYHGSATVKITCGAVPPETQINCADLDNNPPPILVFSGLTDADRNTVCTAVKAIARQVGGDANFLNLAYDAAWNVCKANPVACPPAGEEYRVTYVIGAPGMDTNWGGAVAPSSNANVTFNLHTFVPGPAANPGNDLGKCRIQDNTIDTAEDYTADKCRSYLPPTWRTVRIFQETTTMHESTHMLQAARPTIEDLISGLYTSQPAYWFLYPSGVLPSQINDPNPQTKKYPPVPREVEAQAVALVIEYGLEHDLTIENLSPGQKLEIEQALSGGESFYSPTDFDPAVIDVAQNVLKSLQPLPDVEFDTYLDPSGYVKTPAGDPISDATVTLYSADSPDGPFSPMPDGSKSMSPMNRRNPDITDTDGIFGWDVIAGYYKVRAEKTGCVSAADPLQAYAESDVVTIPPAVLDLDLRLDCSLSAPSPTITATDTATPEPTSTETLTPTLTDTATFTSTPTVTFTRTFTDTRTPTNTRTPSATKTKTPTRTVTPTRTETLTRTPSPTKTETLTRTPSATKTETPTRTVTPTRTPSPTKTETLTRTPSATKTETPTRTVTPTRTETLTRTPSPTKTETLTRTPSATKTETPTKTVTPTFTETFTRTPTETLTPGPTRTPTITQTITLTRTPTNTATFTKTAIATSTVTLTRTPTVTRTPTKTATPTLYPYGITLVQTIPDVILPEKNLPALFDGLTYPNYAIRDFNAGESVIIIMRFARPGVSLTGFNAGFGGDPNRPDAYTVSVESAATRVDLNTKTGSYRLVLSNVSAPGKDIGINLQFGSIVTARFFKVTVHRNDGDQRVHIYEMSPIFQ